ncbi:MAG: GspE/PulE family protein [Planctomycetota bacterium]
MQTREQRLAIDLNRLHGSEAVNNPAGMVDALVRATHAARASDVHIDPLGDGTSRIRVRIDGALHDATSLAEEPTRHLFNQVKVLAGIPPATMFTPEEAHWLASVGPGTVDVRATLVPTVTGAKLALRLLYDELVLRHPEELGLSPEDSACLAAWLEQANGLVLVVGPTGSGKTTTVNALAQALAEDRHQHVVSIEDPVEYVLPGVTQMELDRRHALSFSRALPAALRIDPDCLVIGETRDLESCRACTTTAANGRVVLSSMHARDTVAAVTRLRHWRVSDSEIAAALSVVMAQRLVRRLCPACRRQAAPDDAMRRWLRCAGVDDEIEAWEPVGCEDCANTGFSGRLALFEIWHPDREDYDAIAAGADAMRLRDRLRQRGRRLIDDAMARVAEGATSLHEIRAAGLVEASALTDVSCERSGR